MRNSQGFKSDHGNVIFKFSLNVYIKHVVLLAYTTSQKERIGKSPAI